MSPPHNLNVIFIKFNFKDFYFLSLLCHSKLAKLYVILYSVPDSLSSPELPHWWGGRRGRTGGGGAILWGATDRDGMGDQGKGHRGVSGEATPHAVTTPGHHTRHTPPPQHFSFISSCRFVTTSLKPLFYFLLWWTDLCMPLLDSTVESMLRTCFFAWLGFKEMVKQKTTNWNPG